MSHARVAFSIMAISQRSAPSRARLVVDGGDLFGRLVLRLVAADLALADGVRYNGINDRLRHQR